MGVIRANLLGLSWGHAEHVVLVPGAEWVFISYLLLLFRGEDGPRGAFESLFFPAPLYKDILLVSAH